MVWDALGRTLGGSVGALGEFWEVLYIKKSRPHSGSDWRSWRLARQFFAWKEGGRQQQFRAWHEGRLCKSPNSFPAIRVLAVFDRGAGV